jgi:hypothetical protein
MKRALLLPASMLIALASCRPAVDGELDLPAVLETPVVPGSGFFLAGGPTTPYLSYVEPETRALVLAPLTGSAPAAYLDRITDLPEQDPLSGAHVLFAAGGELHLLYLDREESLLLKSVRQRMDSGTAWIDVLPGSGRPAAAFLSDGGLDYFLEHDGVLWREGPYPGLVRAPFRSEGAIRSFSSGGLQGFTAYETSTHRLLLFLLRGQEVQTLEVARFGPAQDSSVDPEGRLQILAYDPRSFRIVLYQTADPASGFETRPVTLSRGTSSLALARLPGGTGFLFDELSARGRTRYQLCLLHFRSEQGYAKIVLYRSERPVVALQACAQPDALYVALLEEKLRVLRVEYSRLRER